LLGTDTVYSELRSQACTTAETGVGVQSADGFIIEHYSKVRTGSSVAVFMLSLVFT